MCAIYAYIGVVWGINGAAYGIHGVVFSTPKNDQSSSVPVGTSAVDMADVWSTVVSMASAVCRSTVGGNVQWMTRKQLTTSKKLVTKGIATGTRGRRY